MRTFSEDDVLHGRATHLLSRLRQMPVDRSTDQAVAGMVAAFQLAEELAMPVAMRTDMALATMGPYSGERAVIVLLSLRLGANMSASIDYA